MKDHKLNKPKLIHLSSTLYKSIKTFFPPIGLHSLLLPNSRKSRRFELITIVPL
ncbi:unnamed protein product, partial [Vitis vinifera]